MLDSKAGSKKAGLPERKGDRQDAMNDNVF